MGRSTSSKLELLARMVRNLAKDNHKLCTENEKLRKEAERLRHWIMIHNCDVANDIVIGGGDDNTGYTG